MKMRLPLLAFAITIAVEPAATGADAFTINVPVEFKSLDAAVTAVRIHCSVTGKDPVTLGPKSFGPSSGKWVDLPIVGGAYGGPSTVTLVFKTEDFSAAEQAALGTVTGGACEFSLRAGGAGYQPYGGETAPILAQKPGAPFKSQVSFSLK